MFNAELRLDLVEQLADLLGVTDEAASAVSEMQLLRMTKDGRWKFALLSR